MPMNWDGDADRKLFLAVLEIHNVKIDSKAVAASFAADGIEVTPRAIEERMKKLKKMAGANTTADVDGTLAPKGKTALGRKGLSSEGDNDQIITPKKKTRKQNAGKTKSARVKKEACEEYETNAADKGIDDDEQETMDDYSFV